MGLEIYREEQYTTWKEFIKLKYHTEDGGFTIFPKGSYGVGLWKEISKEVAQLTRNSGFILGQVDFGRNLKIAFCNLYNLPDRKGAIVADLWDYTTVEGTWKPVFCRSLNDWELDEIQNFFIRLSTSRVNQQKRDRLVWEGGKDRGLHYKANLNLLDDNPGRSVPV